jgi:hypothetical protein
MTPADLFRPRLQISDPGNCLRLIPGNNPAEPLTALTAGAVTDASLVERVLRDPGDPTSLEFPKYYVVPMPFASRQPISFGWLRLGGVVEVLRFHPVSAAEWKVTIVGPCVDRWVRRQLDGGGANPGTGIEYYEFSAVNRGSDDYTGIGRMDFEVWIYPPVPAPLAIQSAVLSAANFGDVDITYSTAAGHDADRAEQIDIKWQINGDVWQRQTATRSVLQPISTGAAGGDLVLFQTETRNHSGVTLSGIQPVLIPTNQPIGRLVQARKSRKN